MKTLTDADFPQSAGGDQMAYTWVIDVENPSRWLAKYAEKVGKTPHNNPYLMTPDMIKKAVADVICPPRTYATCGIGVKFEMYDPQHTRCRAIYYSMTPKAWWDIKNNHTYTGHQRPAYTSVINLRRLLAGGEGGRQTVGEPLYLGTPIGDNMEFYGRAAMQNGG